MLLLIPTAKRKIIFKSIPGNVIVKSTIFHSFLKDHNIFFLEMFQKKKYETYLR